MDKDSFELLNGLNDLLKRIAESTLEKLSYESKLGKSLKRTLSHFDKGLLIKELKDVVDWLNEQEILDTIGLDYRVKSYSSIEMKYERYKASTRQVREIFNDLLGFRLFCESYDNFLSEKNSLFKIADMSEGKAKDDGYRGVHMYYQKDSKYYPIEFQINTLFDRKFNDWLHIYLYKNGKYPAEAGGHLRQKYNSGSILNEDDFKAALEEYKDKFLK